jgi:hypothetical protein
VDDERFEGIRVDPERAIDLTIAEVRSARTDPDSSAQLATLRDMRERWSEKAERAGPELR